MRELNMYERLLLMGYKTAPTPLAKKEDRMPLDQPKRPMRAMLPVKGKK